MGIDKGYWIEDEFLGELCAFVFQGLSSVSGSQDTTCLLETGR